MADKESSVPIISTKLHRPSLPEDHVLGSRLVDQLNHIGDRIDQSCFGDRVKLNWSIKKTYYERIQGLIGRDKG
jgi:hypothetical protein